MNVELINTITEPLSTFTKPLSHTVQHLPIPYGRLTRYRAHRTCRSDAPTDSHEFFTSPWVLIWGFRDDSNPFVASIESRRFQARRNAVFPVDMPISFVPIGYFKLSACPRVSPVLAVEKMLQHNFVVIAFLIKFASNVYLLT